MRNKIFSLLLVIFLILGIGILVLPQNEESFSEKRLLKTNSIIKFDDNLSKNVETVLKDQFYIRDTIIHYYYQVRVAFSKLANTLLSSPTRLINKILNREDHSLDYEFYKAPLTYLAEGVVEINDNYLLSDILKYDESDRNDAWARGYNVNQFDLKYPDIPTYVYFPTRAEELLNPDYNFEPVCRDWFLVQLNPNIKYDYLKINNLHDHEKYFLKSDMHWNAYGAYEGYKDIINLIGQDYEIGEPHTIKEEIVYPYEFYGNLANKIGGYGEKDHIIDLVLDDIGEFDYYVNGELTDYYAVKEDYKENGNSTIYSDYDIYFGDNYFLREFDFHNEDKPNLLIFGDSYKNTNMMWIASHFNKTIIFDLRSKPDDFDLDDYIEKNDIDIALVTYHYYFGYFDGNLFIPLD